VNPPTPPSQPTESTDPASAPVNSRRSLRIRPMGPVHSACSAQGAASLPPRPTKSMDQPQGWKVGESRYDQSRIHSLCRRGRNSDHRPSTTSSHTLHFTHICRDDRHHLEAPSSRPAFFSIPQSIQLPSTPRNSLTSFLLASKNARRALASAAHHRTVPVRPLVNEVHLRRVL
jgi:hypothetical protein